MYLQRVSNNKCDLISRIICIHTGTYLSKEYKKRIKKKKRAEFGGVVRIKKKTHKIVSVERDMI